MMSEHKAGSAFSPPTLSGLAISREAWLAHIDGDSELRVDHEDEQLVIASWRDREGIFYYRHGVVTPRHTDRDAMDKLGAIASSDSGSDSSGSYGRSRHRRKVIPRAKAAAIVAVVGLIATAAGKSWLDYLYPAAGYLTEPAALVAFPARALYTTGLAAVFAAWILAISSLIPWEKKSSLYAAAALCAGLAVFLVL